MFEEFFHYDTALQTYWVLALLSSAIFLLQAVSTFIGFDGSEGADVTSAADAPAESGGGDFDAAGFHLVSLRSVTSFVLGFAWTGVLGWPLFNNHYYLGLLALVVGLLFMSAVAFLLFQMMRLNSEGTFHPQALLGAVADVYLRIPASKEGSGKITVSYKGTLHELEAVTDSAVPLPTGTRVKVTAVKDNGLIIVSML